MEPIDDLSYRQQQTLAITPKITASLSIPCSIFIIYEAIQDHRIGRGNAVQRAVVGMSCVDLLASFGWFLSTWAVPEGTIAYSGGNQATCNFQGFLLQLAIGAPLYNCSLALYYLLVIKFKWTNTQLMQIEKWVHLAILSFSIGTSIVLLPLEQYNHIGTVCWVIGDPRDCENSSRQASDIPCERGNWAWLYGICLFYGPLWVCVILTLLAMANIYFEVKRTHKRLQRYSASGRQINSLRRSSRDVTLVAAQALLYSASFFITWTPSTIWSVAHWFNAHSFWFDFWSAFCEPLQGFWNFLIFIRRRPDSQEKLRVLCNTLWCGLCCKEPGSDTDLDRSMSRYSTCHASAVSQAGLEFSSDDPVHRGKKEGPLGQTAVTVNWSDEYRPQDEAPVSSNNNISQPIEHASTIIKPSIELHSKARDETSIGSIDESDQKVVKEEHQ